MIKKSYLFLTLLTAFLWLGSGTMWADEEIVLSEGFEGTLSDNWTKVSCHSSSIPYSTAKRSGSKGFRFYYNTNPPQYLISKVLSIPSGATSVSLSFYYKAYSTSYEESFMVGYSTTDNSTSSFTWDTEIKTKSTSWTQYVNNNLPVGTKYICIKYTANNKYYLFIDDLEMTCTVTSTCPKPKNLIAGFVGDKNASFSWTKGADESSWQYVYLPTETALTDEAWSGETAGSVNTTSVSLSGLSVSTDYILYVRADCGSEQSVEISKSFKTPCADYATADLPFEEDFNNATTGAVLPDCWSKVEFVSGTSSYPLIYASNGVNNSKSLRFYGGVTGTSEPIAILPPFEEATGSLLISFWYKNSSPSYGKAVIGYMTDPEDASTFQQLSAFTQNTSGTDVKKFALTGAPDNSYIAIKFTGGSYASTLTIDNIKVSLPSSCTDPSNVVAVVESATSAEISWTENGSATAWKYQLSTDNGETWTPAADINANPYTLTGLTASTTYKVRIASNCGSDLSDYIESAAFSTPCEDQTGVGYEMNFDNETSGSGTLPGCWQKIKGNSGYLQVYNYYAKSGKCFYFYGGVTGTSEQIAILPPFSEQTSKLSIALYYNNASDYSDYTGTNYGQLSIGYMTNPADASTFVAKETLARVNTYTAAEVAMTGAPDNAYIAIRYTGGSSTGESFVDEIVISEASSCLKPTSVAGEATAYNSALISWTENGSATAWQIRYSSDNGESWSDAIDATENPFTLSNLTGNTTYLVQVQSMCSEPSGWSTQASFSTPCAPVDASDYSENFENATPNIGNLPGCWQYREKYGSGYPYVYNSSWYAYAGDKCLYFQGGVNESSEQSVLLPEMDEALNGLTLEFYHKNSESAYSTIAKFTVGYIAADGTTFVPIETLAYADDYTKYTKDLSSVPGTAKCLAIRYAGGESSTGYGYIDNVRIYPTPNCAMPTGVTVSEVSATTAKVAWTENNGKNAWKLQLSNDGNTWGEAIPVTTNPYTLSNLTPNHTTYYVRVATVCGENDESIYSDPSAAFETECAAVALPFNEDFSGSIDCWTMEHCASGTGVSSERFSFYYTTSTPQYLITPQINTEDKPVIVGFNYWAYSTSYPEAFQVGYSTTTDDVYTDGVFTWGAEKTCTNTSSASPDSYSENLPAGVKYIAIKCNSYDKYYLFIDNFSVTEYIAPACPAVSAATLQESNVTAHTATVSWTAGGEETAWNLQYKAAGGEWSAVIPVATTPSYDMAGLAENTVYYVRVQANCGEDLSEWTGDEAFSFPTDCDPKAVTKAQPWECNFDDAANNEMPSCWERVEPYDNYVYPYVDEYSYYAHSGAKYLYFKTPGRSAVYEAYTEDAILPVFNTEIKNLKVSFVYFNGATTANYGQLAIGYVVGDEFTQVGDLLAMVDDYTSVEREMPDNAPDGARIAIRCIGGNKGSAYTTTVYVDDIVVSLKPTCYTPTALAAAATSDGAVLTWTAGKDENEWNVRYSVKDADTWTTINEIATNGYTLTGLSLDVTYEVQVRAYCGENDESEWSASVEFTPVCNAPSALTVTARTMTSATFSWISSESAWVLQYSVDGENWESENVNANPYTLNNLTAGQTYQAKIQAACGSDFSNVVDFTTVCAMRAADELPFSEDFTGIADDALPACWESATAHVESEKLFFRGAEDQIVVLPGYDVALNKLSVSFDYKRNNAKMQFGYVESLGGEFHSLADLSEGTGEEASSYNADLTPASAGYLAFRYYESQSSLAANTIDNIIVMDKSALALDEKKDNTQVLGELAEQAQPVTITIKRTLFCDGYFNTLCLPFDLDEAALAASPLAGYAKLAKFCEATVDGGADELQLVYEYATSIEAGVPYLIKFPVGENIVNPTFTDVTISATAGSNVDLGNDIIVKGILKPEPFTAGNENMLFLLGENKLAWAGITNYLKGFRAYFQLTGAQANSPVRRGMNARIVERQNMPTGIEDARGEVKSLKLLENNQVVIIRNGVKYSVQGQVIQ